jgi:hypothetical protein
VDRLNFINNKLTSTINANVKFLKAVFLNKIKGIFKNCILDKYIMKRFINMKQALLNTFEDDYNYYVIQFIKHDRSSYKSMIKGNILIGDYDFHNMVINKIASGSLYHYNINLMKMTTNIILTEIMLPTINQLICYINDKLMNDSNLYEECGEFKYRRTILNKKITAYNNGIAELKDLSNRMI